MKKSPLNVFVGQARVGAIARSDVHVDTYLFGYRTGCSAENAVSLTMPIRVDPYDTSADLRDEPARRRAEGTITRAVRKGVSRNSTIWICCRSSAPRKSVGCDTRRVRISTYDIVSTLPYMPKDSLALTLAGSKRFPDRGRLLGFIRRTTGRSEAAAVELLEQVADGALKAIKLAAEYGKQHADAGRFVERFIDVIRKGLDRLETRRRSQD